MKTLAVLLTLLLFPFFSPAQAPKISSDPKKDECKISGMVVKLAGSEPLKNARIRLLSQDDRAESHSTTTDAGGRFDLKGIDPGRYRLVVRRDGFVAQEYGQKKPDDPGAILTLRAKQEMNDLLFRLVPSALITGRVINDDGDPLPWVQVNALREVYAGGKKTLFPETTVPTNDLGEYRLFGLRPGRYFIRAEYKPDERITARGEVEGRDDDVPRGYVPMYYPSSTRRAKKFQRSRFCCAASKCSAYAVGFITWLCGARTPVTMCSCLRGTATAGSVFRNATPSSTTRTALLSFTTYYPDRIFWGPFGLTRARDTKPTKA